MRADYHNTTRSSGAELESYRAKASDQQTAILEYFRSQGLSALPPSVIQRRVLPNAPITSVRRAMTNLTSAGLLEKTDTKVNGPYGRPEFLWRLPFGQASLF